MNNKTWKNKYMLESEISYNEIKHNIHYINLKNENYDLKKQIINLKLTIKCLNKDIKDLKDSVNYFYENY